ncbi:hypothetical protein FJ420_28375 [Mesorhizobium sp. B3-1-3]|uniref:hypothetical protein n=1 Tax=unclassified Mesorhizobium TaxID=325217 RepID=UPI001125E720|nr:MULTISPECIES: hypothetical protein [unclassified Mesorhizobium]TPI57363.1 hypothetical protein FJ424_29520 [Mesorhizobium sp. B3-1-8]TPI63516.1 hypothetical protein FJ420_28375 [Mesorhizobium sp. B3-1-3]
MQHKNPPDISEFNSLREQSGYARPVDEFGAQEVSEDHLDNLKKMLDMLIKRRRILAQEAVTYQMTYMGRSYDIAKIQPIIDAIEVAIAHEQKLKAG